ncbi:MAG: PIG-L family deacetylase [Clostridia bacterium]|jgi:LmbE family N-acetylglucosaminyl deacetylase|nr:PIG-L family deacetylase [Clostridia bacterium]MBT7121554.1 PIG-L family deacetylase [Clostridia bacterium]
MRVLFIGAHPDDCEFFCAGTLAKYAARGDDITIAISTNGNIGSMRHERKEDIAAIRHVEAQNACDIIGAKLIWMDIDDEYVIDSRQTRDMFIDVVRRARPDVMFTTWKMKDYNPDHDITGYMAFIARINSTIKLIKTEHPPTEKIPVMFYCQPTGGANFIPEYYVDVTETMDTKVAMWMAHKSQNEEWADDMFHVDILKMMKDNCAYFANQTGSSSKYSEVFRLCNTFPIGAAEPHKLLP